MSERADAPDELGPPPAGVHVEAIRDVGGKAGYRATARDGVRLTLSEGGPVLVPLVVLVPGSVGMLVAGGVALGATAPGVVAASLAVCALAVLATYAGAAALFGRVVIECRNGRLTTRRAPARIGTRPRLDLPLASVRSVRVEQETTLAIVVTTSDGSRHALPLGPIGAEEAAFVAGSLRGQL